MPRERVHTKRAALLDGLRMKHGDERLSREFRGLFERGAGNALMHLNDERLRFPTLFLLHPSIKKLGLEGGLSERNRAALALSETFSARRPPGEYIHRPEDLPVLRWMLRTGYAEEGLGGQFDGAMDCAAILLSREHRDRSCLPLIAEMLFARHRKGRHIYDAEWALFESGDPECIVLVARGLLSRHIADVELARRLLRFMPCAGEDADPRAQYRCVLRWVAGNRERLRYTGEGSLKGNPRRFSVEGGGFDGAD